MEQNTNTATSTHNYFCHCGCGEIIKVSFPNGFQGTTAIITPCSKAPNYIASFEVRKSAVLEMTPADQGYTVQHINGLVTMDVK